MDAENCKLNLSLLYYEIPKHLGKIEGLLEVLFKKIEDFSLSALALQIP